MCLITFAYHTAPGFRLLMTANRDEFYDRPTEALHPWRDNPDIIAGRDLDAGGTWMGIAKGGRFAAVTNYRDGTSPQNPAALSRGHLVSDFLNDHRTPQSYAQALSSEGHNYNGFNLLLADKEQLVYCSNRSDEIKVLEPGVYALSNHLLNTPWPKAMQTREALRQAVAAGNIEAEQLVSLLSSRDIYPDEKLPATGVPQQLERALSAAFIVTPTYGTRSTTALRWDKNDRIEIVEQTFLAGGEPDQCRSYQLGD